MHCYTRRMPGQCLPSIRQRVTGFPVLFPVSCFLFPCCPATTAVVHEPARCTHGVVELRRGEADQWLHI